jgi:nucleolar protein 58
MHLLFETPGGYALFKVGKNAKDDIAAGIKLKAFAPFESTTEAVVAATSIIDGTLDKSLKKFLKKQFSSKDASDELAVADVKLGGLLKEKLDIKCVYNDTVLELFRGVRENLEDLLGNGLEEGAMKAMQLGLSHSLSRYKLKFSADKVDIMVVQAIGLLDDLDKEINIYAMRVREWYGWHFPEMVKIVNDNMHYAKCVIRMGMRTQCKVCDFSDILGDETMEETLKKTAETSMGTEISEFDLQSIQALAREVIALSEYRLQLFDYLKQRMDAIAPNLTVMVGELVGARLISHAGSLLNLAKHPASTIQILGAEKALFRALKTKTDTPKYGLIYHASLIGQAAPKSKGKVSRVLAAKTALAVRVDAFNDGDSADQIPTVGIESRAKVEARIRQLEGGQRVAATSAGASKSNGKVSGYDASQFKALAPPAYNPASDMVMESDKVNGDEGKASKKDKKKDKKRAREEGDEEEPAKKKKKDKKDKQ